MNSQSQIIEKQNDPKMLDCQYAARVLFNRAEKFSYHALVCIILSAFCIFFTGEKVSIVISLVLEVLLITFGALMKRSQSRAAALRQYFDAVVLGINEQKYSDMELHSFSSMVLYITAKSPAEHAIQVNNSGRDYPPGVKNWYEFSRDFPENDAVFECQKQNCWWNDKLCKRRLGLNVGVFSLLLFMYLVFAHFLRVSCFQIIFCLIGLLIGLVDRLYENIKYILLSKTMDDLIEVPDISKNASQIHHLQDLINSRRKLLVLEMNRMHRNHSKAWSEEYQTISKH